ncbi:MAG: FAD-binding oxidoreductase, partial [Pseudopedobacter saltans]
QYYHVFLGRLSLVPILIISLTGTYLSLVKFNIFPEKKIELKAPARANQEEEPEQKQVATFASFKTIKLKDIRSVDFPFADDPDEYYKIKLTDRELMVNQFDGTIVASAQYPMVNILNTLSLNLHTGKTSTIWAIVLTLATINILFFIYSGFVITLRRRRNKIKNKYNITEAEYLLLVASENGSTIHFANHILTQLLSHGEKAHLAELNDFQLSENTQQLLIFASTFGLGDAPTNGNNFLNKLEETDSHRAIEYTIIGFGSTNYPDFCGYAKRIEEEIKTKEWATPLLPLYKVNDRSLTDFVEWVKAYSDIIHLPLITSPNYYAEINQRKLYSFTVADISATNEGDKNFMLTLTPSGNVDFSSGDLLAIYPENNEKERLYSIGKSGKNVRLVVKLHEQGLGSSYLNNLKKGDTIKAAIQSNNGFHLDKKQTPTILVSNGTGIAPFLGMLEENKDAPISVYAGFRNKEPLQLTIEQQLAAAKNNGKLKDYTIAYSRDADISHKYVYELVEKDIVKITQILDNGGVLMICGAIAMHKEVVGKLQQNCPNFELYQSNNQIRSDCY